MTDEASDPRHVPAAAAFAETWRTIRVTGTNGKTSTTALASAAVLASGRPVFWSSTHGYCVDGVELGLPRSWGSFLEAAEGCHGLGGRDAVVEITSQALARGYAKRWRYDIGVFTNLSRDHWKTNGSWEHYLASKAQLFVHLPAHGCAVLNARDASAALIDHVTPPKVRRLWYGVPSRGPPYLGPPSCMSKFSRLAEALFYSFPVQLLLNNLRRIHVLMLCWIILFAMITGNFGKYLGIPYLFLDPEYLNEVSFTSFLIIGIMISGFTAAFNITCYITDGHRFSFIAAMKNPFNKFSLNNGIIPILLHHLPLPGHPLPDQ